MAAGNRSKIRIVTRLVVAVGAVSALSAMPAPASAQDASNWPRQPVKMIVGLAPGAINDLQGRIIAQKLSERLKQPVVVENKPGAGGNIGAEFVARAAPDGYTLLVAPTATLVINTAVYSKLNYDPIRDYAPITQITEYPLYLTVNASTSVKSVKDLIAYAKANPAKANHASPATTFELLCALFEQKTGTKFVTIPFKSNAQTMGAVLNGQAMIVFTDYGNLSAQMKANKVRPLAATSRKRSRQMPNLPTLGELGYKGVEMLPLTGIVAPKATPAPIVDKLYREITAVLKDPAVKARFEDLGLDIVSSTPKEFAAMIDRESARWKAVAAKANIKLD
ncbi:MAG: Bug family tripartite tricarboxylate transporter substrate binding protein [Hyphomicrobiaceae bacterium]